MTKMIMILAGGGGHTGYAVILAEELRDRAELNFLVPDDDPLSRARLEPFGQVETMTKPRHPKTPMWKFILRLIKAFYQAASRVSGSIDAVVSTGSNFCIPPALVAWMKGIPIINLESRVRLAGPSKTASILQHFAKVTALQWEEQGKFLNGTFFGPLLPRRRIEPWNGGYVLVAGGTYGYRELFEAVSESNLESVVLQIGDLDKDIYQRKHPNWKVLSYTDRFEELLAGAEVVVCPPGGTPIEAIAYGKPVVVVCYPSWTRAAGPEDTRAFAEKLNAPLLSTMSPKAVEKAVEEAKKRRAPILKDGTGALVEAILSI